MTSQELPTIALFPGQGSQHPGMGKSLVQNFKIAEAIFEEASDAISVDLKKLCFDGSDSDLALTHNTQPTILTVSVAAFRVLQSIRDYKPTLVAGHSLGEYSALVAANAIPFDLAVRWVRARGTAMQKAVPEGEGGMLALMGMSDDSVRAACVEATELTKTERLNTHTENRVPAVVSPANFNSDAQTVVAGSKDAIAALLNLIKTDARFSKAKAIPLAVSAPFHCELMKPAQEEMRRLFQDSKFIPTPPTCTYIPNVTARAHSEAALILDLLIQQITAPVLWKQTIQSILASHSDVSAIEVGPGKVLAGLCKRISTLDATGAAKNLTLKSMDEVIQ